jgi:hypothetical protein
MLVCEQLEASGLEVTEQLQLLLLSVAEEQADGNIVYSDAIVDAGRALFIMRCCTHLIDICCFLHERVLSGAFLTRAFFFAVRQLEYMDTESRLREMGA